LSWYELVAVAWHLPEAIAASVRPRFAERAISKEGNRAAGRSGRQRLTSSKECVSVRVTIKSACLAIGLICLSLPVLGQAPAQQGVAAAATPAAAPVTKIGVIDIGYIFDNHPTMKDQVASIKAQIKMAEDEINKRRESVLEELKSLKSYQENSAEFKQKEEQIAQLESQLKLDFSRKQKEFAEAEAKVIFDTYKQIEMVTKAWAEYNQIGIVFRYSRMEMDPKAPMTVSAGINKNVVYFNSTLDLTDPILAYLRQQQGATAAGSGARAAAAPATGAIRK
jgi:Skp family chaperone for outer membrane proteins